MSVAITCRAHPLSYAFDQDIINLPQTKSLEKDDEFLTKYLLDMSLASFSNMVKVEFDKGLRGQQEVHEAMKPYYKRQVSVAQDELSRGF